MSNSETKKEYPPSIPFFRSASGKLSVQVTEELVKMINNNLQVGKVLFLNLDDTGERRVGANVTFYTPKDKMGGAAPKKATGGFKRSSGPDPTRPRATKSEEAPDY